MNLLGMLDVLIGIVLVFLLVSLICTALNEFIEGFLKKRAADLATGIKELLQDRDGNGLVQKFYNHPVIAALYKGQYQQRKTNNLPSYIPSRHFAVALYDLLTKEQGTGQGKEDLETAIGKEQIAKVSTVLEALKVTTRDNVDKTIQNIEDWYNGTMDRVSGWYKRRVQRVLLILGIIVAGIMNIDTIAIFRSLNEDPTLRSSLVAAAGEYAKGQNPEDAASAKKRVEDNSKKLRELRLPIGWDWKEPMELKADRGYVTNYFLAKPEDFWSIALKVIGIIITGFAVSLGASFWFDVLNKIMIVRSTVKPKEKSPDEPPVDR